MKRMFLLFSITIFLIARIAVTADESGSKKDEGKNPKEVDTTKINWIPYDEGLELAKAKNKHVLVNFTTAWCGFCKKMNATTFKEPEVIKMMNENFITVMVDGDSRKELNVNGYKITERDLSRSEYRVTGYPAYWFLKPDGEKLGVLPGYQQAQVFLDVLYFMKEKLYDKMTFEEYLKAGGRKAYQG